MASQNTRDTSSSPHSSPRRSSLLRIFSRSSGPHQDSDAQSDSSPSNNSLQTVHSSSTGQQSLAEIYVELDVIQEEAKSLAIQLSGIDLPQRMSTILLAVEAIIAEENAARHGRALEDAIFERNKWKEDVQDLKIWKPPVYKMADTTGLLDADSVAESRGLVIKWGAQAQYPKTSISYDPPQPRPLQFTIWLVGHEDVKTRPLIAKWFEYSKNIKNRQMTKDDSSQSRSDTITCTVSDGKTDIEIAVTFVYATTEREFGIEIVNSEQRMFTILCFEITNLYSLEQLQQHWYPEHQARRPGYSHPLIFLGLDPNGQTRGTDDDPSKVVKSITEERIAECISSCGGAVYFELAFPNLGAVDTFLGTILGWAAALQHPLTQHNGN